MTKYDKDHMGYSPQKKNLACEGRGVLQPRAQKRSHGFFSFGPRIRAFFFLPAELSSRAAGSPLHGPDTRARAELSSRRRPAGREVSGWCSAPWPVGEQRAAAGSIRGRETSPTETYGLRTGRCQPRHATWNQTASRTPDGHGLQLLQLLLLGTSSWPVTDTGTQPLFLTELQARDLDLEFVNGASSIRPHSHVEIHIILT